MKKPQNIESQRFGLRAAACLQHASAERLDAKAADLVEDADCHVKHMRRADMQEHFAAHWLGLMAGERLRCTKGHL